MEEKQKQNLLNLANRIKSYVLTEKTNKLYKEKQKQCAFTVAPSLRKPELKLLFESLFSVRVYKIRTLNMPRVKKKMGKFVGKKPAYKKVYLTLEKNQKIDNLFN